MVKIDFFVGRKTKESFGINRYRLKQFESLKNVDKKIIGYDVNNKFLQKLYPFIELILNIYYTKKQRRKNSILHLGVQGDAAMLNFVNLSPVIVNCLDLIPLAYPKDYGLYAKMKNYLSFRGLKKADYIIALSEFTKKDMVERLNISENKISVAYAGADFTHFKVLKESRDKMLSLFNLDPKYRYIGYIGNEEKRMNLFNQLRAFKKIKNKYKNIKFIKAGKPNTVAAREELKKFIKQEEIVNDIIFLDYIDEKNLPAFYNSIEILMYPITYAGFGLPPLEAMACGCPVITSNLTSLPEVVENAAIIVNPYDANDMSQTIEKLLSNKKLRKRIVNAGLIQCRKFTWERCEKETRESYNKFIRASTS